jgi:hypothetical protein
MRRNRVLCEAADAKQCHHSFPYGKDYGSASSSSLHLGTWLHAGLIAEAATLIARTAKRWRENCPRGELSLSCAEKDSAPPLPCRFA